MLFRVLLGCQPLVVCSLGVRPVPEEEQRAFSVAVDGCEHERRHAPLVHRVNALGLRARLVQALLEEQRDQRGLIVLRQAMQQRVLVSVSVIQAQRHVLGEELPHPVRLARSCRGHDRLQARLPLPILLRG